MATQKGKQAGTGAKKRVVWCLSWENDFMEGEAKVYERGGQYYYRDDEENRGGPYKTLAEAVETWQANEVNETTRSIDSAELTAAEIAAMLCPRNPEDEDGGGAGLEVALNGEAWACDRERFRPVTTEGSGESRAGRR
jgi:hypothetical protein